MDIVKLVSSIQAELKRHKDDGLSLLSLQNHVYGCFIVMEDIVQCILDLNEDHLIGNGFHLNIDSQFSQIGIRYYGFAMDGKAVFENYLPEYKQAWLELFREIHLLRDMEQVDGLEDKIIEVFQSIDKEHAYFMNALEHDGNLSPDWVERALYVMHPSMKVDDEMDKEWKRSALSSATSDHPKKSNKVSTSRKLSTTRRQRSVRSTKPCLATTRRAPVKR
jgi:hypothetical protein